MLTKIETGVIAAVVAVVVTLGILTLVLHNQGQVAGAVAANQTGVTNFTALETDNGIQIGAGNPVAIGYATFGTCYIQPYATTIAASSSAQVDCQGTAKTYVTNTTNDTKITGVQSGDTIEAVLSSTTIGNAYGGLVIGKAIASTTAGFISLVITNNTGTTFTWPVNTTASGTAAFIDLR